MTADSSKINAQVRRARIGISGEMRAFYRLRTMWCTPAAGHLTGDYLKRGLT
jgi:hypothetical protein